MTTMAPLESPMGHNAYDMNDFDKFINFDQAVNSPAPTLNKTMPQAPVVPSPQTFTPTQQQSQQQQFSGPSHNYDLYKQQTGIPTGSLASTIAVNQTSSMPMNYNPGFPMHNDAMFMSSNEEFMEFASPDMKPDFNNFVQPVAAPMASMVPPNGRMYPGMHQQQAALAKARIQQAQQEEAIRQQQQRQAEAQASRNNSQQNDPFFEERISRVLQQMRQASVVSQDDDNSYKYQNSLSRKKEEEEMDADERLLASEEGKKLSSKERRQLRNKVSARAFRSRRKEYISQLEGEVAAKASEANDLRAQNRALMEENARLNEMSRMLLSSPHFQQMLEQMNANGMNPLAGLSAGAEAPNVSAPMGVPSSQMFN